MSTIANFITTGNFKSLELTPKEQFRRLEDHTSKVKEMFDLVIDNLGSLRSGMDDVSAKVLITAQENTEAYVGGSGVVDHALLSHLNYADAGHVGFESTLGNPAVDGYILSSTALGVRSWIVNTTGTVVDVTATSPLFSSGTTTKNLSIQQATTAQAGYMSAAQALALSLALADAAGSIAADGFTYGRKNGAWASIAVGGSVTDVSVVTNDGVSGSVANSTTTPAITLTLGTITPAAVTIDAGGLYKIGTSILARLVDTSNWFLGTSGNASVSGSYNLGFGYSALEAVAGGNSNICFGTQAGYGITSGSSNILIGTSPGLTITTGSGNVVIGNGDPGNVSNKLLLGNSVNNILDGTFHATESSQTLLVRAMLKSSVGYQSTDGSTGATGSFTTADSKTVTVKNGLVTSIV